MRFQIFILFLVGFCAPGGANAVTACGRDVYMQVKPESPLVTFGSPEDVAQKAPPQEASERLRKLWENRERLARVLEKSDPLFKNVASIVETASPGKASEIHLKGATAEISLSVKAEERSSVLPGRASLDPIPMDTILTISISKFKLNDLAYGQVSKGARAELLSLISAVLKGIEGRLANTDTPLTVELRAASVVNQKLWASLQELGFKPYDMLADAPAVSNTFVAASWAKLFGAVFKWPIGLKKAGFLTKAGLVGLFTARGFFFMKDGRLRLVFTPREI